MRTAEIFNGNTLIKVTEGSVFSMNGVWNWDVGTRLVFNVKQGINVVAVVTSKDGSGSQLQVVSIEALDDLANMHVEAEDTEAEIVDITEEAVKLNADPEDEKRILILKKNRFTKKEIVAFIESNNLDIDTSLTKAELVNVLESLNLVEFE